MSEEIADRLEELVLGGAPLFTREEVMARTGAPESLVRGLWRAMGFPDARGAAAFTSGDVEAVRTVLALIERGIIDESVAVSLARGLGQTTSRLADWQVEALGRDLVDRGVLGEDALPLDDDPRAAAAVYDAARILLPALESLLGHVWRRQVAAVLERRLSRTDTERGDGVAEATVGFADLVGFTRLARQLEERDLAAMVERFESVSADVLAASGVTLVKTVGDEILFAADDCVRVARAALRLHAAHARNPDVPEMRIGIATGPVLRRMGDVFGATVNLASRLTALARPGTTLIDPATALGVAEVPRISLRQTAPRRVRGVGIVRAFVLAPAPGSARDDAEGGDREGAA